jgi:hypothetical protein
VWSDDNLNGALDAGESGFTIFPITVSLYRDDGDGTFIPGGDTLVGTQTPDATGAYRFGPLVAGLYWVRIDRAGFYQTAPVGPDYHRIPISPGVFVEDANFGLFGGI